MSTIHNAVQLITNELVSELVARAKSSSRRRTNHNFHAGAADNPQRFLNVFVEGTYVAPHRHRDPPKTESFLVLEGFVAVLCFDDSGTVVGRYLVGRESDSNKLPESFKHTPAAQGIDLPAGVWHTIAAVTPYAVCFEVKPGPWDASTDKEFAPWAPMEGDPDAKGYLATLLEPAR